MCKVAVIGYGVVGSGTVDETYNPLTGERSYCGVPLPADAPPRPNGRATWDNLKQSWI